MSRRIRSILLICNSYDGFSLEEDGRIETQIAQEYAELGLSNPPQIRRVETTADALTLVGEGERFDQVITMYDGTKVQRFHSEMGNCLGFCEKDGSLFALGLHGLQTFRDGKFARANVGMNVLTSKDVIYSCMSQDSEGNIYIGTRGLGLFRLSDNQLKRVEASTSGINPATAKVSTLLFDHKGNLWLGCHGKGLLMLQ